MLHRTTSIVLPFAVPGIVEKVALIMMSRYPSTTPIVSITLESSDTTVAPEWNPSVISIIHKSGIK